VRLIRVAPFLFLALLAACALEERIPMAAPKRLAVDWDHSEWRICAEGKCARPTPKTVLLVLPLPVAAVPPPKEQPLPKVPVRDLSSISVTFSLASWTVTKDAEFAIKRAVARLAPGDAILVEGRTDDVGTQSFNDRLARKRADAVVSYLKRSGNKHPIEIRSHGKCCYAITNTSNESRAANRRVDLHFSSTQKE